MVSSYLSNRTQRPKIHETVRVVPQGSTLGALLFNFDIITLFYESEESNIASYTDDTYSILLCSRYSNSNFRVGDYFK